jgi:UDP-N-acetylglucosamine--N-acetylmuramyl-(pentapeptide) pyrophosphoryl-undecaprenol N-acetylglucosamine transferase
MKKTKIFLIGGGTGGHILPLRNLADVLKLRSVDIKLIVADSPLDRKIVAKNFLDIETIFFRTGKIRRYFSWQNFVDFFIILKSIFVARKIIKNEKPDILFFKGGFVGFPFLVAVRFLLRFQGKIFAHESDILLGRLTNLLQKYADKTFANFDEENPMPLFYAPNEVECGSKKGDLPKLLILGGSQGAQFLNEIFLFNAEKLCEKYFITCLSGLGKLVNFSNKNFEQFEFLSAAILAQKIHESDLLITRAGANSLFEIVAAKKSAIAIPLPSAAQNHQFLNAEFFAKKNLLRILLQNEDTKNKLCTEIELTLKNNKLKNNLLKSEIKNRAIEIADEILSE